MRIGGIQGGPGAARRAARGAGGFALPDAPATSEAAGPAPASSVAALVALQERPTPGEGEEQARRRGEAALEELRGLQLDLLRGRGDPARLEKLARLAGPAAGIADPVLRSTLAGIALRARVELARRQLAAASNA